MREELLAEFYAHAKARADTDPFCHDAVLLVEDYRSATVQVHHLRNALRTLERDARQMRQESEDAWEAP